jgi:hypothetical protein
VPQLSPGYYCLTKLCGSPEPSLLSLCLPQQGAKERANGCRECPGPKKDWAKPRLYSTSEREKWVRLEWLYWHEPGVSIKLIRTCRALRALSPHDSYTAAQNSRGSLTLSPLKPKRPHWLGQASVIAGRELADYVCLGTRIARRSETVRWPMIKFPMSPKIPGLHRPVACTPAPAGASHGQAMGYCPQRPGAGRHPARPDARHPLP